MTVLEARIAQMRQSAVRLRESGRRIDISVKTVHHIVDDLLALGVESPAALEFVARYRHQKNVMDDWGQVVMLFAQHLEAAAAEVEMAVTGQGKLSDDPQVSPALPAEVVPFMPPAGNTAPALVSGTSSMGRFWRRKRRSTDAAPARRHEPGGGPAVVASNDIPYDGYLSKQNRPLYQAFLDKKAELAEARHHLDDLRHERMEKLEELAALRNRLMSHDSARDIDSIPRVQALKQQIAGIEGQITAAVHTVRTVEIDLARLHERLQRIVPAPGADLNLVASMEGAQTLQVIKEHTQDCVNYIVNRMAIPPGLPTDAHLWNDNIARMPEYGISTGHVPLEGSVLVMEREHSYADDIYGHLMYVEKVENGQVWITDNKHAAPVLLSDLTAETAGPHITYLYFPWQTKG